MSRRWWAADIHANHANICIYCRRPWLRASDLGPDGKWVSQEAASLCAERMNAGLARNINMRVKPGDRGVHVGDFSTKGKVGGIAGTRKGYLEFLDRLNGTWTLLEGNHDPQGRVKTVGKHLFGTIGPCRFFASHYPTDSEEHDPLLMDYVRATCHFAICGHVHGKWHTKACAGIINVNVGVDANGLMPISDDEVLALYFEEKRRLADG